MAGKYKKNSMGLKILSHLGESLAYLLEGTADILCDPYGFSRRYGSSREFQKHISRFKESGYLQERNGKLYVTEKGRIKIIKNLLKDKSKKEKSKWDKKWRGIIFDIPEANRKERDFLRRELKTIGLIEVQQSVWLFPFDIEKELRALLKLWKTDFKGDIRFILIEKMNDKDLKERFNLV